MKIFIKVYLTSTACSLLIFFQAQAQSSISGQVQEPSGQPLAFANVLLLNANDSTLVKGMVTTETGAYQLDQVKPGEYLLAASMVGYRQIHSPRFTLLQGSGTFQLSPLQLIEAVQELGEVVVAAQKPLFEQEMDRMVVNVKSSIISAGSTVLDVLARTPGIAVNPQTNTITMNGKEGVMVMFNGKLTRLPLSTVVQMLSGMNADQVEKIEIIATPPAKYDAEGNAGLINIVNSRSPDLGTNGSFSGNVGYSRYEIAGASFNLNHRAEKISFYIDYSGMMNHFQMLSSRNLKINLADQQSQSDLKIDRDFRMWTHNARTGVEFALGPKTILGSQFTAFSNRSDQIAYNETKIIQDGTPDTRIDVRDRETNHWWNYGVNLNLTHHFTPDRTISTDFDYLYYFHNNPHDYRFVFHHLQENRQQEEQLVNSKHTPIHMWVGRVDYQHTFADRFTLETGIKGFLSDVDNKLEAQRAREGIWTPDTLLSQHVLMEENIGAAYVNLNASFNESTQLQAGLRYEYTHTYLQSIDRQPILERNYGNLFPSFSFSKDISENNKLQLSYSRRITRPTYNDLAPFFTLLDPFTYIGGNIELLPALSHSLQANCQFRKSYQLTFDVARFKDLISWDMLVFPDQNLQVTQTNNFDHARNLSLTLSAPNQFAPWWEGHTSVQGVHQRVTSVSQDVSVRRSMQYVRINTTQTLRLGGGVSAEVSGFYQSRSLAGLLVQKSFGSLNVGLQKELKNNAGTLKLAGEDLLWTQRFSFENSNAVVGFETDLNIKVTSRLVRLTYTRNFGNKNVKAAKRSTGSEEERQRVSGS